MKVVIREEIIIEDPSKEMLDYIHTNLITDNPEYDSRKRMGLWLGGVDPYILFYRETVTKDHYYVTVPFGCLRPRPPGHPGVLPSPASKAPPFIGCRLQNRIQHAV